jgi:hypothetical protein
VNWCAGCESWRHTQPCGRDECPADNQRMAKKRGYSTEFPTNQRKRIKREIDWVPPVLDRALRAKLKREGLSLRALTLRLWTEYVAN